VVREHLDLLRGCAKAISVRLHSKLYESLDIPVAPEFASL
jgi:hypothetical protein